MLDNITCNDRATNLNDCVTSDGINLALCHTAAGVMCEGSSIIHKFIVITYPVCKSLKLMRVSMFLFKVDKCD